MEQSTKDFAKLDRSFRRRIAAVSMAFRRAPVAAIDWDDRLICIRGPRGCGKTTAMFQRIREAFPDPAKALSDGAQQLTPGQFADLVAELREIAAVLGKKIV